MTDNTVYIVAERLVVHTQAQVIQLADNSLKRSVITEMLCQNEDYQVEVEAYTWDDLLVVFLGFYPAAVG